MEAGMDVYVSLPKSNIRYGGENWSMIICLFYKGKLASINLSHKEYNASNVYNRLNTKLRNKYSLYRDSKNEKIMYGRNHNKNACYGDKKTMVLLSLFSDSVTLEYFDNNLLQEYKKAKK